ncbi:MAG: LysM peptidoglycan-binding domain-containing protein [Clostridium sp.]
MNLKRTLLTLTLALATSSSVYAASYEVKSGDTLSEISKAYNSTTSFLMKTNDLSKDTIYSGQVLDVPTNTYNVVKGDTLFFIAKKYNISLKALRTANDKWSDTIYPEDVLKIPASSSNGQSIQQQTSGVISYSNSDVDLLARLITAEAGGESYNGMLAVGAVVVNRVQSSQFPTNVSGVINERSNGYYQFSPVLDGNINKVASTEATKAAYESLKGTDPTNGSLYFFENSITNKWLTSKPVSVVIGNHTFAY